MTKREMHFLIHAISADRAPLSSRVRVPIALDYLKEAPVENIVLEPMDALELAERLIRAARVSLNVPVNDPVKP